jgi:hypothetical protein
MIPIRINVTGFPINVIREITTNTIASEGPKELTAPVLIATLTSWGVIPTDELVLEASLIKIIA